MTRFDAWFRVVIVVLAVTVVWSVWAAAQTVTNATVEFAARKFGAGENAGVAPITLQRNGPTNAAVSVVLTASPGTAAPGEFVPPEGPITVPAGQRTHTIEIRIVDDFEEDGNKTVRLSLSEPSGGATLGPISTADLVISDNEAKQSAWLTFGLDRVPWMRKTILDIPLLQYTASLIYIF